MTSVEERIQNALDRILCSGGVDGSHHKQWTLDQVVRILTDCPTVTKTKNDCRGELYSYEDLGESDEYLEWARNYSDGEDGPDTYGPWDIGIAP